MTDRYHSLVVTLEEDIREDDAESLINAIKMIRGVLDVRGKVANISDHTARMRAWSKLHDATMEMLRKERP